MSAFPIDLSFIAPVLASGLCASIVVHLWHRRDELGAAWLLALTGSVGVLNAAAALGALLGRPDMVLDLARFTAVMRVTGSAAWLGFALAYSGLAAHAVRASWAVPAWLLVAGLGMGAALSESAVLVAGVTPVSAVSGQVQWLLEPGSAAGLAVWLCWIGMGLATVIILTHLAQAPGHWAQRVAVLAAPALVGVGAALPSIPGGAFRFGVEPLPVASALAAALVAHVLIGDQPTGAEPVARSAVVEEMEDAVLVLGRDGSIVDLNRSARERLGLEIRGPLPLALGMAWCSSVERARRRVAGPTSRVELELVYGTRASFELTTTPLGPRAGRNRTVLVLRDVTDRERMEQELRRASESLRFLANTDSLTDLANRRFFEERLHEEVERAHRYGRPLSLILLDLDHFKTVNDTWGHPAGDRVLRATADVLKSVLREHDVAGRLGGEELAVVLPETDEEGARALADRLRREIKEVRHRSDDDRPFHVTASVGIAWLEEGALHDADALFSTADEALYEAKGGGRDRVVMKAIRRRVDLSA